MKVGLTVALITINLLYNQQGDHLTTRHFEKFKKTQKTNNHLMQDINMTRKNLTETANKWNVQ